jgi:hypothetical protein
MKLKESGIASGSSGLFAPLMFLMIRMQTIKLLLNELPDGGNP